MNKELCFNCGDYQEFYIENKEAQVEYKGEIVRYNEKIAYCKHCNEIIEVEGLWDENLLEIQRAYCKKHNRCCVDDINKVLKIYKIGKEPLAQMLGWGKATIKRYFTGMLPSEQYSNEIKKLIESPKYFKEKLLEAQKDNKKALKSSTYKKVLKQIENLLEEQIDKNNTDITNTEMRSQNLRYGCMAA